MEYFRVLDSTVYPRQSWLCVAIAHVAQLPDPSAASYGDTCLVGKVVLAGMSCKGVWRAHVERRARPAATVIYSLGGWEA